MSSENRSGSALENLGEDKEGKVYATDRHTARPKREGHDQLIAKLTPPGTTVRLYMMSGMSMIGELAGSDRFTISLRECWMLGFSDDGKQTAEKLTGDGNSKNDKFVQIIYKHGIESMNFNVHGDKELNHDDEGLNEEVVSEE